MSSGLGEAGAAGPLHSSLRRGALFPAQPHPPPSCALLQASRLEEWLSSVVRVAYVPKLNGTGSLAVFLGTWSIRTGDYPASCLSPLF